MQPGSANSTRVEWGFSERQTAVGDFYLQARKINNVFQLLNTLGTYENDMSRSVAWALGQCPEFLKEFVKAVVGAEVGQETTSIRLQISEKSAGITDVEIESPGKAHIIVEAKRGLTLPTQKQLSMYARRLAADGKGAKCLVALTDCPLPYVKAHFSITKLSGIPVIHLSWAEIASMARRAQGRSRLKERYVIDELLSYLKELVTMQQVDSNWVFVVALSSQQPEGWGVSWIEVVTKRHRYFHPVGNNWPPTPPNYIAFRYYGELQSIHHIDGYAVVTDIHEAIPDIPKDEIIGSHFVYRLGPAFRPDHRVPSDVPRAGRRWCMLDTLFTCESISAAGKLSAKRNNASEE
jgi:hypothetical protein